MKPIKNHEKVIKAWQAGSRIEAYDPNTGWEETARPNFYKYIQYRVMVKPGELMTNEWIDLKDQKPPEWNQVLVALDNGTVTVGFRGSAGWHWEENDSTNDDATATHWMPWPKAPAKGVKP